METGNPQKIDSFVDDVHLFRLHTGLGSCTPSELELFIGCAVALLLCYD